MKWPQRQKGALKPASVGTATKHMIAAGIEILTAFYGFDEWGKPRIPAELPAESLFYRAKEGSMPPPAFSARPRNPVRPAADQIDSSSLAPGDPNAGFQIFVAQDFSKQVASQIGAFMKQNRDYASIFPFD